MVLQWNDHGARLEFGSTSCYFSFEQNQNQSESFNTVQHFSLALGKLKKNMRDLVSLKTVPKCGLQTGPLCHVGNGSLLSVAGAMDVSPAGSGKVQAWS